MVIPFALTHVFTRGSNPKANAHVLRVLLESLIAINRYYLREHQVPTLYRSGVYYRRTNEWLPIPELYKTGYGDCKSLAAALIAEYLQKGREAKPVFREIKNRFETWDFHILVQTPGGFEDPSKVLGMNADNMGLLPSPLRGG